MIIAATIVDKNKQTFTAIVDTTINALFDHTHTHTHTNNLTNNTTPFCLNYNSLVTWKSTSSSMYFLLHIQTNS